MTPRTLGFALRGLLNPHDSVDYVLRKLRIAKLTGTSKVDVQRCLNEFTRSKIVPEIRKRLASYHGMPLGTTFLSEYKGSTLYTICRLAEPQVVVETGVASGVSSTLIVHALEDNQKGELYSIDLPNNDPLGTVLPEGKESGWLIPDKLRHRWKVQLGDSSEALLPILMKKQIIDIFLHDSLHTYRNMLYEFETAWPFLRDGGILLADDSTVNTAFKDFCIEWKPRYAATFGPLAAALK